MGLLGRLEARLTAARTAHAAFAAAAVHHLVIRLRLDARAELRDQPVLGAQPDDLTVERRAGDCEAQLPGSPFASAGNTYSRSSASLRAF